MYRFTLIFILIAAGLFVYSIREFNGESFPGIAVLGAAPEHAAPDEILTPADLEVLRGDGALIRLSANKARLWRGLEDNDNSVRIELTGNVVVYAPEGEIRAAGLEYEPASGTYTAPALSFRPVTTDP